MLHRSKNSSKNSWLLESPKKHSATLSSSELPVLERVQWDMGTQNRRFLQQPEQRPCEYSVTNQPTIKDAWSPFPGIHEPDPGVPGKAEEQ